MNAPVRPNILFIAMDDMNEWLGCLGEHPQAKTPHIDRLAAEGTLFTHACCPSPVCNPSRTSFLTGLRPHTTGCYFIPDNLEDSPRRGDGPPFPLYFRRQGYRTLMTGKVDHGGEPIDRATRQTFGESMWDERGSNFGGQQFHLHSPHADCMPDAPGIHTHAVHWGPLDGEDAESLADRHVAKWAADQLERDFDRPFLLAAGFHRPHVPLIAPRRFFEMYEPESLWLPPTGPDGMDGMPPAARQVALAGFQDYGGGTHRQIVERGKWREIVHAYLAAVSFADHCIGQVLDALRRSRYAENTVVILASDNGWGLGEHFHWQKWSVFDSGARVPLVIRAPGLPAGEVCAEAVDLCDLYPTLIELCGLGDPGHLEGESLVGLLSGEQAERKRPALTSFGPNNHSLRTRRYRYSRYCDGSEELYDYEADPWEHRNLADEAGHASVKAGLARWMPGDCAPALVSTPTPGGPFELEPGDEVRFNGIESGFAGRRVRIAAEVRAEGDGTIVHHASYFAGYALYVRDGRLGLAVMDVPTPLRWDRLDGRRTVLEAETPLPDEAVHVEGVWEADGTLVLRVADRELARGVAPGPLPIYPAGVLEAGRFSHDEYEPIGPVEPADHFPGTLRQIRISFE